MRGHAGGCEATATPGSVSPATETRQWRPALAVLVGCLPLDAHRYRLMVTGGNLELSVPIFSDVYLTLAIQ